MLLDHFHPPLTPRHHWESFHSLWAGEICAALNSSLPRSRFLAEVQINVGPSIKTDVAESQRDSESWAHTNGEGSGGTATAVQPWIPATAGRAIDFTFPDEIQVRVYTDEGGSRLVGVIELVSPSNKDRLDSRRAFAGKCAAYLHRGIGLVVVDVVSSKRFDLHRELFALLGEDGTLDLPADAFLYSTAYHPVQRGEKSQVDVWAQQLTIGDALPVMPLALLGAFFVPIDLEATYNETRRRAGL